MIDNVYPESIEESGNYLRLSLKNISDNQLPYNPIAYALWYDYATGRNPQLIEDIAVLLKSKEKVEYNTITELFRKHIADNQILSAEKKTRELQKILAGIVKLIVDSGGSINLQGTKLKGLTRQLEKAVSAGDINDIAEEIINQTETIVKSSMVLSGKIDAKLQEIKTLRNELEGIKKAARTDVLTGLLNRFGFQEAMVFVLQEAKQTDKDLSVILLDIDYFKEVNDQYGHLIGDNVLKMVGKIIKANIKGKDIACRFGGDEFIIALPDTPSQGAYTLAERFRESLKKTNWKVKGTGETIGQISLSLGVAAYKKCQSLEQIIERADKALYQSKRSGKDRTTVINATKV